MLFRSVWTWVGGDRFHLINLTLPNGSVTKIPCGSAWKRDPVSGVIGVEKGPLILVF